jgi:hypothetical protein
MLRVAYDEGLDVLKAVTMKSFLDCNILSIGVSDVSKDHIAFIYTVVETKRRTVSEQLLNTKYS